MERFHGLIGGGSSHQSTADVDGHFSVAMQPLISGNSAGVIYEELIDPDNLDFRPRDGSLWAQHGAFFERGWVGL